MLAITLKETSLSIPVVGKAHRANPFQSIVYFLVCTNHEMQYKNHSLYLGRGLQKQLI